MMAFGLSALTTFRKVAHAALRDNYTGASLYGFPKWSDDAKLNAIELHRPHTVPKLIPDGHTNTEIWHFWEVRK